MLKSTLALPIPDSRERDLILELTVVHTAFM